MSPMVAAVGRDVDRHVADDADTPPGRVAAKREPLALEPHLLLDGVAAGVRRPVVAPPSLPCPERPQLARLDRRLRVGEEPAPRRERRCGGIRGAELVRRVEGQDLPPARPCRRQPVDEGERLRPQPAARQRGRDGAGRRLIAQTARRTVYRVAWVAAERITIADVTPSVDCGRWPAKACVGDSVEVDRDDRPRRARAAPGRRPPPAAPRPLARGAARRARQRPLPRARSPWTRPGGIGSRSRHGSTATPAGSTSTTARSPPARPISPASSQRARRSSATGRSDEWRAAAQQLGHGDRHDVARSEPPLEIDVERERARASVWYELFPRSWGGLAGVVEVVPELAELGVDVLYLPPIHPIGETNRKGRNNVERAARGRRREPLGDRRHRRRARRDPPRARHRSRSRGARRRAPRERDGARARPRPPGLARSPLAPRASRVVPAAPRRLPEVRREPAKALPGHPQLRLGHARPQGPLEGDPRRRPPAGATPA